MCENRFESGGYPELIRDIIAQISLSAVYFNVTIGYTGQCVFFYRINTCLKKGFQQMVILLIKKLIIKRSIPFSCFRKFVYHVRSPYDIGVAIVRCA